MSAAESGMNACPTERDKIKTPTCKIDTWGTRGETELPYQKLFNLYLLDCAKKLKMRWVT